MFWLMPQHCHVKCLYCNYCNCNLVSWYLDFEASLTLRFSADLRWRCLDSLSGPLCWKGSALLQLVFLLFLKDISHRCTGSILKNQEDTFAAELHRLKQQPLFSLVDFESVVDWIRSTVAEVGPGKGNCCTFFRISDWPSVGTLQAAFMFLGGSELHVASISNDKRTLNSWGKDQKFYIFSFQSKWLQKFSSCFQHDKSFALAIFNLFFIWGKEGEPEKMGGLEMWEQSQVELIS